MWKKALWVYIGLFVLGFVILGVVGSVEDVRNGEFRPDSLIGITLMFIPGSCGHRVTRSER